MDNRTTHPTGMKAFTLIWIGQVLSLLGTAISNFGMQFWIFDASGGRATPMTRIGLLFTLPMVIFSPFVGVLVDKSNRKLMMMLSDLAAALITLVVLILFSTGTLEIWHLYITAFIGGTFQGFQWPAYSAAITTMLDKLAPSVLPWLAPSRTVSWSLCSNWTRPTASWADSSVQVRVPV
jgi:MFS family permease